MTLHMIKLCVGIEDVDQLAQYQRAKRNKRGNSFHRTRMMPTRAAEILDGGSLYWVIKGFIQVRQQIVGIEKDKRGGPKSCVIELDPKHVLVQPTAHRAFQGWRYLKLDAAPRDIGKRGKIYIDPDMPKELKAELMRLGLI